jgi:hypothetical protein
MEKQVKFKTLALMTVFAAFTLPGVAYAYDPDNSADVFSRPRPDFDARGVRLGSFLLFPTLTAGVGYHDNVFNVPDFAAPSEDFLFILNPTLRLNSDWSRHALNFRAESQSYFYQDFSDEDRTDWKVAMDGRFDIGGGTNIKVDANYGENTEARSTDTALLGFDLTEYSTWGAGASINHVGHRLRASLGVNYDEYDYDDVGSRFLTGAPGFRSSFCPTGGTGPLPLLAAGSQIVCNNDDRDMTQLEVVAKLGYAVSPGYALFIRGRYDERDFNSTNPWLFPGQTPSEVSDANRNHDSDGWGIEGGVDFEVTRLLSGEAFIGYAERSYDNHPFVPALTFPDTDAFTFGVDLHWYASMMTTVTFNAKRTIEDNHEIATIGGVSSGYISDRYGVRVDHELMRNFVLFGKVGFGQDEFQVSTRDDDVLTAGIGAIVMINNNLHLTASYDFVDRDSNIGAFDYTNNAFMLTLTGKL